LNIKKTDRFSQKHEKPSIPLDQQGPIEEIKKSSDPDSNESIPESDSPSSLTTWLNTEQAADYLGVSVGSLRNMTSNGQIPYYKLGRRNRYRLPDLHELLLSEKRGR
jgi:excisionase family DNA binding protein